MKSRLTPYLLAVLLVCFTILGALTTSSNIAEQESLVNSAAHRQVVREIVNRFETYVNVLLQTRSMFYVTREVSRKEFKGYIQRLNLSKNYPGLQGIGFAKKVMPQDLKEFEKSLQNEIPGFQVWPDSELSQRFPIIYLEPDDWRNLRAMGYDMFSENVRHEAMERAILEDRAIISAPVKLVQETNKDPQLGFLIYVPVYETGAVVTTEELRRENIFGLVYSPFRTRDLFTQIVKGLEDVDVNVEVIYDGQVLYRRYPEDTEADNSKILSSNLEMGGRSWTVRTSPRDNLFPKSDTFIPLLILVFGSLLSIVITFFLVRLGRKTHELEEQGQNLRQIQEASRVLTSKLELKDVLQSLTDIGLELSKAEFGAFFYNTIDDEGQALMLYTLSGVEREKFEKFPMPRYTEVFSTTFKGETLLSPDITLDPRFGKNEPHFGLPKGHLPVKSYLAVAVKSKSGEVIGALFYGHSVCGCFGEREKDLIEGLAQQAAIAVENATLYQNSQKAIATREEFLNIASHELKTPITSMQIQFQSAMRMIRKKNSAVFEPANVEKRISLAIRQLEKMQKLIEEMLDSSRISLGKFEIQREPIDLRHMVKELIERYEEQFRARNISVLADLGAEKVIEYEGDEYRLEQVFSNLLNNAIKYGDGGPIEIQFLCADHQILFSVKDHGAGIAEENLPKVFERYERLVSSNNISGLGLGLYISKNIVEAHGGEISVESVVGEGSTFTVKLPQS